jgi:hypothetical protein
VADVRAVFTTCLVIVVVGLGYVVALGVLHR